MTGADQALRAMLQDGIAAGTFRAGAKLPTERELVEMLAASRPSVRKALSQLEREGLITRQVGRGTFLTSTMSPDAVPVDSSPATIMQARLVFEPSIASTAALTATAVDLETLERYLNEGGKSADFESFESWDAKLHRAIAVATQNDLLIRMFDVMNAARDLPVWGLRKRQTSTPERRRQYHHEHEQILKALQDRDPEGAEHAMRVHLRQVGDALSGGA